MTTGHSNLKSILIRRLRDALRPYGFKHRGICYTLHDGDVTKFLSVCTWPRLGPNELRFTLDISVTSEALVAYSPEFLFKGVHYGHAPIHERIGWMSHYQRDVWWDVSSVEECESVVLEIMSAFKESIWPYLASIRSNTDLAKALRHPPRYNTWPSHLTNWAADVLDGLDPGKTPPPPSALP